MWVLWVVVGVVVVCGQKPRLFLRVSSLVCASYELVKYNF